MPQYGFLNSTLSAADAVAAGLEYGQLQAVAEGLFWVEYRPDEGRNLLIQRGWNGDIHCLTPTGFSVRSCVYEYGGKSWCPVGHRLAFVNAADQQIWLQQGGQTPLPLTQTPDCRYGDLIFDQPRQRLLAVQEQTSDDPTQPLHRIVAVDINSGAVTVLVSGDDFYAAPVLSPDGQQLAWISWNHPHMPWVSTQLNLARIASASTPKQAPSDTQSDKITPASGLIEHRVLAGETTQESLQQPRFLSDNSLVAISDISGWWNLYRYLLDDVNNKLQNHAVEAAAPAHETSEISASNYPLTERGERGVRAEPLWSRTNDFGLPSWQLGVSTWDQLDEQRQVACYMQQGEGRLAINTAAGEVRLAEQFSLFRHICCYQGRIYCIASAKDRAAAIVELVPAQLGEQSQLHLIAGGQRPDSEVALPQPICYPVAEETAYGFLYLPLSATESTDDSTVRPPLLVFSHGGPTAATYPLYNPKIQFWTSRGFAVLDLNYRGSTGYGRDYRLRLAGSWGQTDWQDAEAAVDYLAEKKLIDPAHVFIRGGSAGGYTTLCALAFSNRFKGGASYYGVSDPMALTRDTHKFESHYLDWLIGDPQQQAELYRQRSPLVHADQINCPMIFFQGGQDRVVVPQQTDVIVNALKQRGIAVEYHLYPDEQHGFRQASNQVHSLEAELQFYQRLLI
ncbi:prolyl oligopeptidase family serine peptidase [Amphritea sp. 2_MG-2023]|uniref:S9 family peptidase n=1 Tax=Amphritea TaxID=515417 RepID=UPI001C07C9DA|nr:MULTISPECIES: prolyl oligopeptidase family serine peptidase [Amphritea]MBU2965439.1 prolyl oligopeptidase family serine peptidase [Amphritea atlantica]MDO6418595.1 prolyl oligopeptidase family serine peptidase [Amphritea sp. 2_MG-2023]